MSEASSGDAECAVSRRQRFADIITDANLSANDAETILDAINYYKNDDGGIHRDIYALMARIMQKD